MRAVPGRADAFTVFAQQPAPALEVEALVRQAARFFSTTLAVRAVADGALTEGALTDGIFAAQVTVNGETRACFGRARTDEDLAAAQDAETRAGYTGMSLLAARCATVWLVEVTGARDDGALLVAAVLASVVLGPILSPDGTELFGVKTARGKLGR
jgi:hypothetical protein